MDEEKASSSPAKPSASGQPAANATMKKEAKKRRKRRSSGSLDADADAEAMKKKVAIKVRKSNKKSTRAKVPDLESLYRLRDYPEDDELEFVTHELAIAAEE